MHQTLETVFHRLPKLLEFRKKKYSAVRRIFNSLLDQCLDIPRLMYHLTNQHSFTQNPHCILGILGFRITLPSQELF